MKDRLTTLRSHWNARKASGTRLGAIGTARRAILYCSLAGDIISGGERFLFLGSPKSFARMGRAEALVARRLSGAAISLATQVPNAKFVGSG